MRIFIINMTNTVANLQQLRIYVQPNKPTYKSFVSNNLFGNQPSNIIIKKTLRDIIKVQRFRMKIMNTIHKSVYKKIPSISRNKTNIFYRKTIDDKTLKMKQLPSYGSIKTKLSFIDYMKEQRKDKNRIPNNIYTISRKLNNLLRLNRLKNNTRNIGTLTKLNCIPNFFDNTL